MITAHAADLAKLLRQGPFLDAAQQAELPRLQASAGGPHKLVEELVRRGWLTAFQAEKLLAGQGGELVLGPYLLLDQLGQGGMGAVYRARHLVMNRLVALKVIRPEHLGNAETVGRFQREIQAVAKLQHPHIVLAHDAGKVGDIHFLAMELLDGVTLSRLVQQRGGLPVGEACAYTRQAALALQHAHEQDLVHRDVKPTNLMLTKSGVVKLLDLGLARPLASSSDQPGDDLTHTNAFMGTPDFLAPEQANDARSADIRADIYSLGCTLYYLLTAKPPFPGGTLTQKLRRHEESEPPSIAALRDDVPPALAAVLHRMMAKKPRDRYTVPRDVAAALGPFCTQGGEPVQRDAGSVANDSSTASQRPGKKSLANGPATHPERGFTLEPDTPPTIPSQLRDATMREPPAAQPSSSSRRTMMIAAAAGLVVAVILAIIFWPKGDTRIVKKDEVNPQPAEKKNAKLPKKDDDPVPIQPPPGQPGPRKIWVLKDDGKPIMMDFTTKLGIRKKITVASANVEAGLGQTAAGQARSANPKRKSAGLELVIDQGHSTFLVVPLGLVKSIRTKDKVHAVSLMDGSTHMGTVRTTVRDEDGKAHDLGSVAEATVTQAPAAHQEDMETPSVRLTVMPPLERAYNVFSPKLHTGRGGFSESFEIKTEAGLVQGNLSEFDFIKAHRKANWMMTLRLPSGKEQTGQMPLEAAGWWWLVAETDSGPVLVLRGENDSRTARFPDHPGFTLEKSQAGHGAKEEPPGKRNDLDLKGKVGDTLVWAPKEDGTPIIFDVTTKLDVRARVNVKFSILDQSRAETANTHVLATFPKIPRVPMLALELGKNSYVLVPLALVKRIASQPEDRMSSVQLRDGTSYSGQLLTTITSADDGKTYDLAAVKEARLLSAPPAEQVESGRQPVRLTVLPAGQPFPAFGPTLYYGPGYGEAFTMKVDGDNLQGNLSDFAKVTMAYKGTDWLVSLETPGQKSRTGPLVTPNTFLNLIAQVPSGAYVVLMHESRNERFHHPGFVIEQGLPKQP